MNAQPFAIVNTGLITSVGLNAPATCAAIHARIANPTETRFEDSAGEWLQAHCVPSCPSVRGLPRLALMATAAMSECLSAIPREEWSWIPLLMCVAERDRPGRLEGVEDELLVDIQDKLRTQFAPTSRVIPQGRAGIGTALLHARELLALTDVPFVLVAATDSLVSWPTLNAYERRGRLLTSTNSNGFIAGEGAGALLLGRPASDAQLVCAGIGVADEAATVESEQPLRGDGLTRAIKAALADAGCALHDLDFRITDLSGEQYYFKESALALNRILRVRKEDFQLWHPAEFVGEVGAAAGPVCLSLAASSGTRKFAPGRGALLHFSTDQGARVGIVSWPAGGLA
jgi:3-oxoacyl-[acyl-carrier-protein] synthase-1